MADGTSAVEVRPLPSLEEFARFVSPEPNTGCHLWTGSYDKHGYGRKMLGVGAKARRPVLAHRISYEIHVGPIAPGLVVLHRCDVPACVNPAHLSVGTSAENSADMKRKGRSPRGERQASARLTEDNVREIRSRVANGTPQREVAAAFGVARSTLSQIVSKQRWGHV